MLHPVDVCFQHFTASHAVFCVEHDVPVLAINQKGFDDTFECLPVLTQIPLCDGLFEQDFRMGSRAPVRIQIWKHFFQKAQCFLVLIQQ